MAAEIDFRKAVEATDGQSAKDILTEFAQSLKLVSSAGKFVAEDGHYSRMFAYHNSPSVLDMGEAAHAAVLQAYRETLQDSSEKLAKMADVLLDFLGD